MDKSETTTYYTTEYRLITRGQWQRKDTSYVRGTNIMGKFQVDELEELRQLVDLAQQEHHSEYRIVKVTETTDVVYLPPAKITQLPLTSA